MNNKKNIEVEIRAQVDPSDLIRLIKLLDEKCEFRDVKRRLGIGAADFHHLATSIDEGCSSFVTVDERHLLGGETVDALKRHIDILSPKQIVQRLW